MEFAASGGCTIRSIDIETIGTFTRLNVRMIGGDQWTFTLDKDEWAQFMKAIEEKHRESVVSGKTSTQDGVKQ